jgi:hypothetical protein
MQYHETIDRLVSVADAYVDSADRFSDTSRDERLARAREILERELARRSDAAGRIAADPAEIARLFEQYNAALARIADDHSRRREMSASMRTAASTLRDLTRRMRELDLSDSRLWLSFDALLPRILAGPAQ